MKKLIVAVVTLTAVSAVVAEEAKQYPIACWTYMRVEEQTRPVEQEVKDWTRRGRTPENTCKMGLSWSPLVELER